MTRSDGTETQRANRRLIKQAIETPLLSREREFELARRWRGQGDEAALHELILAYTRLAVSLAARYRNYGLPMGDLVQEGAVGLLQAAQRFEPERDIRFSTYATWWIRSAMQDYILRNWSIVRTGTTASQKSLFFNLRRLRASIEGYVDGPLDPEAKEKIARALNVSVAEVAEMEARLQNPDQSLNLAVGEASEDEWQDFLADTRPLPEEVVIGMGDAKARSRWLDAALKELNARERTIIGERRLREEAVTLEELGKELGISKERVRQIEHRALEKLRASLGKNTDDPSDLLPDG